MSVDLATADLPETLETVEDYDKVCENFVLPFLHRQAGAIADVIVELHKAIDKGDVQQEQIDSFINEIKQLAAFATEGNPMYSYFEQVIELEQRLDSQGLLTDDDENS